MDTNAITTAIGTLGFPIVMCLLMYRQNLKESENHAQEMNTIKEALNNNTVVLQKLTDKLDGIKNE